MTIQLKPKPEAGTPGDGIPPVDPASVQRAVEDICNSAPFRGTRQCQDLLRYVVVNSLAGQEQLLRERVIGAEVFKRSPDYEPSEDPIVRNRAAEVRKRLAQYYQAAHLETGLRIEIPAGSYRAVFEQVAKPKEPKAELTFLAAAAPPLEHRQAEANSPIRPIPALRASRGWLRIAIPLLLIVLGAGLWLRHIAEAPQTAYKQFWAPILSSPKPILICMGSNAVYRLSDSYLARYRAENKIDNSGVDFYVNWKPNEQVDTRDLHKAWNSFVALGDVAAVSEMVATVTSQGRQFQERFPPDVSFAELQNAPAIVIGGYNNYMGLTLTKDLRFQLAPNGRIVDQQNPKVSWAVKTPADSHDTEDYAIVSRLLDSKSGKPVVCIAGIGGFGTQAAASFIGNAQGIEQLIRTAPANWSKKNLQLIVHTRVVDYRPISTEIVASTFW